MRGLIIGQGVVEWVAKRTNEFGNFGAAQALGWQKGGKIVAGVVYEDWNGPNVNCHIASDGSKRWLTREYLWHIFDYPFRQLKVSRMTACVGEGNSASRRFVEKLGFALETTLQGAHPSGDLMIYRMTKDTCRWIKADFCRPLAKAA